MTAVRVDKVAVIGRDKGHFGAYTSPDKSESNYDKYFILKPLSWTYPWKLTLAFNPRRCRLEAGADRVWG
jgi:hypothetical protein